MSLKNEVLEKLADIDCKDKVKEALSDHKEEIVNSLGSERSGVLDRVMEKVVSRKLLVFGVATALF